MEGTRTLLCAISAFHFYGVYVRVYLHIEGPSLWVYLLDFSLETWSQMVSGPFMNEGQVRSSHFRSNTT